ncbi:MAG: hypothetical protein AAF358_18300 [Pseudomonadota bacterium]
MKNRGLGFGPRAMAAVALLLLTVPWWPGLNGEVAGIPAWAAFSLLASVVYAVVVGWLLQRHWNDGGDDEPSPVVDRSDRP